MSDNKQASIFSKVMEAAQAKLEVEIQKARTSIRMNQIAEQEEFYEKAVTEEPTYSIHSSGWKEKPTRLQNSHLKQLSVNNTIVAAIIQTRQNQVAAHSKLVESEKEKGFRVILRNERDLIEEIKIQLREKMDEQPTEEEDSVAAFEKANGDGDIDTADTDNSSESSQLENEQQAEDQGKDDDDVEEFDWELERKAKEIVRKKFEKDKKKVEDYVLNCGIMEGKTFKAKQWNFDLALRALTRDTLAYDLYGVEIVPDRIQRPHHWFPIDGGTIKYATVDLRKYKDLAQSQIHLDILYPEKQIEKMEEKHTLDLDQALLDAGKYKWVQVVRGKIERAYTEDELKVGIRNPTTDIYNNGYGLSEVELSVGLITGHINAEYYNQAYFKQGFSAKGILHIKKALNRRKMETIRQQWHHMIRGARNSFQTPIFAGVDDVQWIPLTQNHDDIGFEGWMRYLIKMTCAIFQIDPHEIGIGFKDEGSGGGGISGDNTKEKMQHSKDKGLVPLVRHLECFVNEQILKPFDDRFCIQFTGLQDESRNEAMLRQKEEVQFKKTVNEIRAEDGLPPLPGMDNIILSQAFMTWYQQFSKEAKELMAQNMENQQKMMMDQDGDEDEFHEESINHDNNLESALLDPDGTLEAAAKSLLKSQLRRKKKSKKIKIEYYRMD